MYCPRQCALIHLEREWAENRWTAEGRVVHERVDTAAGKTRKALRIARGVPLVSERLGLAGKADVVEFHAAGRRGGVRPFPVEYKRGRPKDHDADRVQLCAQALCLEEMLGTPVPEGALFYAQPRRRELVVFDAALRARTQALAGELRTLLAAPTLPPPAADSARCRSCSLSEACGAAMPRRSARGWLQRQLAAAAVDSGDAGGAGEAA